jgi:ankyrin repeat protein
VTNLIRGAIFRSGKISKKQGKLSLDIYPLGTLVDMYHYQEAKLRHDKIYALLGMSTDDGRSGLEPDYNMPWEKLMRNLAKFLLGDEISVDTWNNREVAVIKSRGCVLGRVSSVSTERDNSSIVQITLKSIQGYSRTQPRNKLCWNLPSSAKRIKEGDMICLLQGAPKPTIIRLFENSFVIIMITVTCSEYIPDQWSDYLKFTRDFLLVWDWEKSPEDLQDSGQYSTLITTGLDGPLGNAIRSWNFAQILGDLHDSRAEKEGQKAKKLVKKTLREEQLLTLEAQYSLIPLLWATINGYSKIVNILLADGADLDIRDWAGRTLLSLAAENGHEGVVKLLLDTGKVDIDIESKDSNSRSPLSYAAENGHEGVIKLLLDTGKVDIDIESKDSFGRSPLSYAAENGHEGVVKLLLDTGKVDIESKDNYGRSPLSWAARNAHEGVIKLLLDAKADIDIESKDDFGRSPLYYAAKKGHEGIVKLLQSSSSL